MLGDAWDASCRLLRLSAEICRLLRLSAEICRLSDAAAGRPGDDLTGQAPRPDRSETGGHLVRPHALLDGEVCAITGRLL